jgi:hypothetical protein
MVDTYIPQTKGKDVLVCCMPLVIWHGMMNGAEHNSGIWHPYGMGTV